MLRRLRRIASLLLVAALVFLIVPPLHWAAGDLWLLARAGGAEKRERAVTIILATMSAGTARAVDSEYLFMGPPSPAHGRPVIVYQPRPNPIRDIPACAGADALPRSLNRYSLLEHARVRSFAGRTSTFRLVALSACINASPLAARCGRSYLRDYMASTRQLIPHLERLRAVRVDNGRACWLLPGPDSL